MPGTDPPPPPPQGKKNVARSDTALDTHNTVVSPTFALVILDTPAATDDSFTLVYPPKKAGGKGKEKKKTHEDALKIDDAHVGIRFDEVADDPKNERRYKLVQNRKKAAHTIFKNTNTKLLYMAGEKPPQNKRKQYFILVFSKPKTDDADLKGDFVDFSAIKVKEPKTD